MQLNIKHNWDEWNTTLLIAKMLRMDLEKITIAKQEISCELDQEQCKDIAYYCWKRARKHYFSTKQRPEITLNIAKKAFTINAEEDNWIEFEGKKIYLSKQKQNTKQRGISEYTS